MFKDLELTQEQIDWITNHPDREALLRLNALIDRLVAGSDK